MVLDAKFLQKMLKIFIDEFSTYDNKIRQTMSAYDVLPREI